MSELEIHLRELTRAKTKHELMKRHTVFTVALLTFAFAAWFLQATRSGWCNDESAHIPAGLYHLETGRMDAYRVNPPLPRMLAAIPLFIDRPEIDWRHSSSFYVRSEYLYAHDWVVANIKSLPHYLFLTRSTSLIFLMIGLWAIVRWAGRIYGNDAAALAAAMWSLNPDIIANSAVVAADLPAAAMGLLAGYRFWDWLVRAERPFPWSVAVCVALAILCKFSWLFLLPTLPLLTLAHDLASKLRRADRESAIDATKASIQTEPEKISRRWLVFHDATRLTFSFLLTLLIINWCYGFEGTGTRLGSFQFISHAMAGVNVKDGLTANRLAWIPLPIPSEMLCGLDYLNWEFEKGKQCYLRGTWQHRGWWYFHLYAMAVKIPLGYWVLIAVGIFSWGFAGIGCLLRERVLTGCYVRPSHQPVGSDGRQGKFRLEWLPILIAAIFIALVSSQTGFTHHVRYVLPAYGFLFLLASRALTIVPTKFRIVFSAACLSGTVWFHATHPGLAHTFFNPLVGGPNNGWRHLGYSNVDWGQSTYRMVDWVREHPEQRPMTILFRSSLGSPQLLVADQENVFSSFLWQQGKDGENASPVRPGYYLISSYRMTFPENRYFWDKEPIVQPYPDVLLFQISEVKK
jgi:hypothetical protein